MAKTTRERMEAASGRIEEITGRPHSVGESLLGLRGDFEQFRRLCLNKGLAPPASVDDWLAMKTEQSERGDLCRAFMFAKMLEEVAEGGGEILAIIEIEKPLPGPDSFSTRLLRAVAKWSDEKSRAYGGRTAEFYVRAQVLVSVISATIAQIDLVLDCDDVAARRIFEPQLEVIDRRLRSRLVEPLPAWDVSLRDALRELILLELDDGPRGQAISDLFGPRWLTQMVGRCEEVLASLRGADGGGA